MKTRNIGGSLLPSSEPRILKPIPYKGGKLIVRPLEDEDTHALYHVTAGGEKRLASHPNGYSCHCLAERMVNGDKTRVMSQAAYIVACGGDADYQAIEAAL